MKLLIIDELGYVPLSTTGAELLFEVFSQRYERGSTIVTSNLPFEEWTSVFGAERLTGALLDRLTHHVHILSMNGESYRLLQSTRRRKTRRRGRRKQAPPKRSSIRRRAKSPPHRPGKIFAAGMKRGPMRAPFQSYRQISVTAGAVRRRRLWADGQSAWR